MDKNNMILSLGNALIMLDHVTTCGEQNLKNLYGAMQQIRAAYRALKEGEADETEDRKP